MSRGSITYVGHATVLLDLAGVRLLTDPLLRPRVAHLRRAGKVDPAVLRGLDTALISHLHYDHLDFPSLQRLGRELPIVVPRGSGGLVRRKAASKRVVEVGVDERIEIGALGVRATRANHDTGRLPFGVRADPLGFVVESPECRIYFAGDTDIFDGMAQIGPVDVALLPIWGWGPTMGPGHLDPVRAAQAAALLNARIAIPIHWGTYYPIHLGVRGQPNFLRTPPELFRRALEEYSPTTELRVLQPGASTGL